LRCRAEFAKELQAFDEVVREPIGRSARFVLGNRNDRRADVFLGQRGDPSEYPVNVSAYNVAEQCA
jgi:hypothetical protein